MRKLKYIVTILVGVLAPTLVVYAVVKNLNEQVGKVQSFTNDTNVIITSSNNTHALGWSGILPVLRGGTGASSFATGSVLFFSGGKILEDTNLTYDNINGNFNVGGLGWQIANDRLQFTNQAFIRTGQGKKLFFQDNGGVTLMVMDGGGGGINMGSVVFTGTGNTRLQISGSQTISDSLTTANLAVTAGNVQVVGTSSTVQVGDSSHPGCMVIGDSDGIGFTYITANDGVLTATTTKPNNCR